MIFESLAELIAELSGRFGDARRANDLAVDVREWFTHDNRNNNQGDEQHAVHSGGDEKREHIIDEENVGERTINYGDASLGAYVSLEARR